MPCSLLAQVIPRSAARGDRRATACVLRRAFRPPARLRGGYDRTVHDHRRARRRTTTKTMKRLPMSAGDFEDDVPGDIPRVPRPPASNPMFDRRVMSRDIGDEPGKCALVRKPRATSMVSDICLTPRDRASLRGPTLPVLQNETLYPAAETPSRVRCARPARFAGRPLWGKSYPVIPRSATTPVGRACSIRQDDENDCAWPAVNAGACRRTFVRHCWARAGQRGDHAKPIAPPANPLAHTWNRQQRSL